MHTAKLGAPLLCVPSSCTIVYRLSSHAPAALLVAWYAIHVWSPAGLLKKLLCPVPKCPLPLPSTHRSPLAHAAGSVGTLEPSHSAAGPSLTGCETRSQACVGCEMSETAPEVET
ncbi:hypothetical protein ColKHC_11039 [Colletotrichum higginsianum]|nr:hypothetical protein ColKHC_11039 [Colletotrichum higginsianum]